MAVELGLVGCTDLISISVHHALFLGDFGASIGDIFQMPRQKARRLT